MPISDEELDELELSVVEDVKEGITSTSVDGLSVTKESTLSRIEALQKLRRLQGSNPFSAMRHRKLRSPGGGFP